VPALGGEPFHAVFIRAPVVESVGAGVQVLASVRDEKTGREMPVAVEQGTVMASSFHPELTNDSRFHAYFLDMVRSAGRSSSSK
jgi:5'-phosphate synthase pdxT subunit